MILIVDYADNVLTVKSLRSHEENKEDGVIHRGISKRYFQKRLHPMM